ncbi:FG-GAP-like repeat-containing protein [Mesonia mobilis]|uniref:FG-GAP-like repeat-containing protein n=1 Tax=Mesonia mobilis TaxID=369791 RepID=UPI0026F15903|nr:FG-GAP-like repeat-containing protein [Mesonia mobilis]
MKKITFLILCFLTINFCLAQNTCEDAIEVDLGNHSYGTIDGDAAPINCAGVFSNGDHGEWYKFTPENDYNIRVSTDLSSNTGGDSRFHVYEGSCENLVCIGGDDDSAPGPSLLSVFDFNAVQGVTYYIVFDNNWSSDGYDFEISEYVAPETLIDFNTVAINLSTSGNTLGAVDMNGDYLDDIISISSDNVNILEQTETDVFNERNITTSNAQYLASWSFAVAVFDANGYNDLLYGAGNGVTFMKAADDGNSFTQISGSEYVFSQRSNFVDINKDGHLDAFVCHDIAPNVYYMNDGSGNLTYNQGGLGDSANGGNYGSIWIDYDNDGDSDLFIAKCRGGNNEIKINQLHRNNGDGTFTEVGAESGLADPVQAWSSAWADFDNDGFMDVFVGANALTDGSHKLMRNNGDGTFTDITLGSGIDNITSTGIENVAYDFNNDGYVDIFGVGGKILINNGDLTFTDAEVNINNNPVGDLNNDGFLDIVSNNNIYYNQPNGNNWLKVALLGTESNRNGIGARIEVTSSLGTQIRDVKAGVGFRYMNSLNTHFGIGEDTEITKITVKWPSGIIDEIDYPSLNSTLVIEEGSFLSVNKTEYKNLSLYPNPAKNQIAINAAFGIDGESFEIYSITGQKQITGTLYQDQPISIEQLSTGIYFLRISVNGKSFQRKFIKE